MSLIIDIVKILILFISIIICSNGLNILGWNIIFPLMYYAIINLLIIAYFIINQWSFRNTLYFDKYARYLLVWPIVVILFTNLCGGSTYNELRKCFPLVSIFYFLYARYRYTEKNIIVAFTVVGLITVAIQIYEQIYPEMAIFGVSDPESDIYIGDIAGKRNDLYRLWVGNYSLQIFCFTYYVNNYLKSKGGTNLVFIIIFAISIYLYLTRQLLIIAFFCLLISFLLNKKTNTKKTSIIIVIVLIILLIAYWEVLFLDFFTSYQENTYTTDIRWKCMGFLLEVYFYNPIAALVGHGHLPIEQVWANKYGYYLGDVGIVGDGIFYYGLVWACLYILCVYYYFTKFHKKIPIYISTYVFATFLDCIFCFPLYDRTSMLVWISVLYITSTYYIKKNLIKNTSR